MQHNKNNYQTTTVFYIAKHQDPKIVSNALLSFRTASYELFSTLGECLLRMFMFPMHMCCAMKHNNTTTTNKQLFSTLPTFRIRKLRQTRFCRCGRHRRNCSVLWETFRSDRVFSDRVFNAMRKQNDTQNTKKTTVSYIAKIQDPKFVSNSCVSFWTASYELFSTFGDFSFRSRIFRQVF